jgi:hypothetical protein
MNIRKTLFKGARKILNCLPLFLRAKLIRLQVKVPLALDGDYVFKIALTQQELESSFQLVYRSYLKLGYCTENEFQMRGTKFHALKSTSTLIAKFRNQVVGTLTVVRDNKVFGLPLEQSFCIDHLRSGGNRLAEITSLVIDPEFRQRQGGKILFPLLKLMHDYATFYFGTNKLVIAISPKDKDFYQSLLMFDLIKETSVQNYLGAPAIIMSLDLDCAEEKFFRAYSKKSPSKNLYHFFKEASTPYIKLPQRPLFFINDLFVSKELYLDLFVRKLKINEEKLERLFDSSEIEPRRKQRIEIDAPALIELDVKPEIRTTAFLDVSENGFRTKIIKDIQIGQVVKFVLHYSNGQKLTICGKAVWSNEQYGIGFQIIQNNNDWAKMIDDLQKRTLELI